MLIHGASSTRAYVGVYAILLAVLFDPFAQQLVHYYTYVVYAPSASAAIPRAQRYDAGNRGVVYAAVSSSSFFRLNQSKS